jgi:predicted PurR-regulated permease PerM
VNHARKKPPVVRLPPKSTIEIVLAHGAQAAMILVGLVALVFALQAGKYILAPVFLAVVVGLMFGPIASAMEKRGVPPSLSAGIVVLVFLAIVSGLVLALAAPLSTWAARLPQIWNELQLHASHLREPLEAVRGLRDEIRSVTGEAGMTVSVEDGSPVESMAMLAPAIIAQVLIFFASLYFFVATRHETRVAVLRLCLTRRLRWRVAHIFRDVETLVSRYLLSITIINVGLGIAVALALYLVGVPSAALWGALAGLLNFVIYIGPAVMALILFGVGLATFDTLAGSLMPPLVYLAVNAIEAQFVTPLAIGRAMMLNPFVVFLALAFWIWLWGPLGGFVAIPALLIIYATINNIVPGSDWALDEPRGLAARIR